MSVPGVLAAGDRISSAIPAVGRVARAGTVLEVIGGAKHPRYRVEWDDGHESIVYPAQVRAEARRGVKPAPRSRRRRAPAPAGISAAAGDRLVVHAHRQGEPERDAEILETLGPRGTAPFRIRWSDTGHEVLFFPAGDAHVEHLAGARRRRGA
jgi:hypothetical protein